VEFERVVPASRNMQAARRQFWLGPHRSGMMVTFWAGTDVIHLSIGGARVKTLRSHLSAADLASLAAQGGRPAGPPPLPPAEPGAAIEVDRIVSRNDAVHLGSRYVAAGEILAGRRVSIRIEDKTLMFFDPQARELLRTRPSPLPGTRPAASAARDRPGRHRGHRPSRSPCSASPATPASSWSPAKRSPWAASTPAGS
jgi:hypothetical protein